MNKMTDMKLLFLFFLYVKKSNGRKYGHMKARKKKKSIEYHLSGAGQTLL